MLTLYGAMASRSHRVVWLLKELGVPFDHVPTNFIDGSTRKPDFLAINPNGRVPVLDDDGFKIFESMAINLYLAKKYGGPLAPRDLIEDALMTQWSFWVVTEVEKPLLFTAANTMLFAEGSRNSDEAAMALGKLQRPFKVLEAHLKDRDYLLGDRFTVADLNVAIVMEFIPLTGINIDAYPRMKTWLSRCLERPAAADWKDVKFTIPRPPTPMGILQMFL